MKPINDKSIRMKVLYCNPSFWEYRLPFYVELNRLFKGDFHILYSTKRYAHGHQKLLERIKDELGENAHPYDNELMFDVKTRSFHGFSEGGKQIPLPFGLWKRIAKVKPDVLITEGFFQWTPWVQLYGLLYHVPVFMGYERTLYTERNNSKLKTWIRKIQDKLIKGYLVNGSETKKYLESIGVASEKIHIGGMSADSDGFRKAIAAFPENEKKVFKDKYKMNSQGVLYLFTGKLIGRKGILPLLAAWMKHIETYPNDSLVVVGDGEQYDECKSMYGLAPSIHLEGGVPYDEIYKYYAIADVYILPTIEDNWSLVIPEAMACGLPVATSVYNGCHVELIHEGENGITFDTYKQESLVNTLAYFHYHDLKAMGQKSIEIEKSFNTETCARREYEGIVAILKNKNGFSNK